jgi:phospholipid transport system transporter-binding protein
MSEICSIKIAEDGSAYLSGELTFESTPQLYHQAQAIFRENESIRSIDLAGITSVDSAGLALMLEWQASRTANGQDLRISNAPASLISLARLCEAAELLSMTGRAPDK